MNHPASPTVALTPVKFDALGAFFSCLCILHCLALPLMAAALPVAGVLAENPMVHQVFALVTLAAGVLVWWGARPLGRGALGVMIGANLVILATAFVPMGETAEVAGTVIAASALAIVHSLRIWTNTVHRRHG